VIVNTIKYVNPAGNPRFALVRCTQSMGELRGLKRRLPWVAEADKRMLAMGYVRARDRKGRPAYAGAFHPKQIVAAVSAAFKRFRGAR